MKKMAMFFSISLLAVVVGCGSSPSETDTTPPDPSSLTWSVDFSLVQLSWDQCSSSDFGEYQLYRSTSTGISQSPGTPLAAFSSISDVTYNDDAVEQDEVYYYALKTIDTNSLTSWSNEIEVSTPVEAIAGYWEGSTEQGKTISFYVTTDITVGEIQVTLDISGAPDISVTFPGYTAYEENGAWVASGDYQTSGGDWHSLSIEVISFLG